jgi:cobalt-zinc-cadmium efflux system protein
MAQAATASSRHLRALWYAAALGVGNLVVQVVVGLSTRSLAVLSELAHVVTDVFGIAMAIGAILVARAGSKDARRTFGLYRAEVFAALLNSVLLFLVAFGIAYEAIGRFADPPAVPGLPVVFVAVVGLTTNTGAFLLLRAGAKESLNVRGACLEVTADMVGSFVVLVSGAITLFLGWRAADPIAGIALGVWVLPRAFTLGKQALRILLQQAPDGVDVPAMRDELATLDGVTEVHDLHVWTLTSGMEVVSAHLMTVPGADDQLVLRNARQLLADRFHIEHATLQIESEHNADRCRELTW